MELHSLIRDKVEWKRRVVAYTTNIAADAGFYGADQRLLYEIRGPTHGLR